jgi:hypothetical protein
VGANQSLPVPGWLLPSVSHWLWLLLLVMLLSQPWRTAMVASDGDACMHWRVGEWMLEHKQIIRTDVFSYTRIGHPIISKEWLAEIVFATAGRLGGLFGLAVVAALVIATTFALLHRQLLREGNEIFAATGVTLLATWAACSHWLARPHVFSFLLALLWHNALRRFERTGDARRLAFSLGVLTLAWVNLHGAFLAGFMLLGAYWLGAIVASDRRKTRVLTAVAVECALVSLANPSGYKLHIHNLQFLRTDYLMNWLAEYRSTDFHSLGALGFAAWLALIFVTLALRRPRFTIGEGIVLLTWTYFALVAARNIPLLAILTAPILCPPWSEFARGRWPIVGERIAGINRSARGWPLVAAVAFAVVALAPHPTKIPPQNWPVEAVEFIKRHPERFSGKMFNQYVWGGYLMQVLPEHKVFIDGRTDFYGVELIKEFVTVTGLGPKWTERLRNYNVAWTLMPTDHRLNLALELLPDWQLAYSNETATIYCRVR